MFHLYHLEYNFGALKTYSTQKNCPRKCTSSFEEEGGKFRRRETSTRFFLEKKFNNARIPPPSDLLYKS